ncbi:hypothetical protein CC85DRAFT_303808 [Cutaneotrichosporon oleaginosum]|uniref:Uncharacterized protein n=1 Tax=Cutaneotrichosporon oleaginosum TaxID=879819 RepID=A0A0J0XIF2_9TREE|nr:uncharacterized protein CC85DRAFT_303808 [Cutaneotrichosporon oleaginosum]KLT40802.1 hypothetical protein CC85DRAFT_303808 [Cutaneotrichosporon oleaginosum]TXT11886.1 hypothetical protein COLE_02296 [Cutaneotrichosporon oleaginosum]
MSSKVRRISLGGLPEVRVDDGSAYHKPAMSPSSDCESAANNARLLAMAARVQALEAKVDALHVKLDAIIDHLGVDRD